MIIRVRIRNFLSFNKEIEFSMIPGQGRLKKEHKTTPTAKTTIIKLNLDDGVKVNYRKVQTASDGKFYEILADSKNIMAKEK